MRAADGTVRELGKIDVMELRPGEVLEIGTPCGGFGDALERDAQTVAADVQDAYVSAEAAREYYGVVLRDGHVDEAATRTLRAQLAGERPQPSDPDVGPERRAYEAAWTDAVQSAINEAAWRWPAGLRAIIKEEIQARVAGRPVDE